MLSASARNVLALALTVSCVTTSPSVGRVQEVSALKLKLQRGPDDMIWGYTGLESYFASSRPAVQKAKRPEAKLVHAAASAYAPARPELVRIFPHIADPVPGNDVDRLQGVKRDSKPNAEEILDEFQFNKVMYRQLEKLADRMYEMIENEELKRHINHNTVNEWRIIFDDMAKAFYEDRGYEEVPTEIKFETFFGDWIDDVVRIIGY